ncbi:hypothetical protein DE146DRAFT_792925 [Phaeosphaeria sp. MPI-PUGE-AT-0046c]|nr:hypothetical protein DE146DRAFT_792925 [Phaeosphaeria sp. MPI-PUGE-AT-0046c]
MAHTQSRSPVSPVDFQPLPNTFAPVSSQTQTSNTSNGAQSSNSRKGSWLPFTLQWYYMIVPTIISLCLGSVLVYLTIHSKINHGIGADNGSSAILFGWRFTPTLIAVLFTQMTVILFEDVKRSEPFTRLATAPVGGASAYGTVLQTPRAWWSIFIDVCFRRKRIGHTSWSLICAAFINVIALLVISPLSSALLTSEEVLVPRSVEFSRIVPRADIQIPMVPTRETYYRAMNAVMRNVSTSAWLNDTSLAFPFWPSTEAAQYGPSFATSYGTWNAQTTALRSKHQCQNMTLKSADVVPRRYSDVYVMQSSRPVNGTQPMAVFVLESGDGCKYELSIHPAIDMAARGGVTWSEASTFIPTIDSILPIQGRVFTTNMTSTHIWSRVNASEQCRGRDIIIANTPFTVLPKMDPRGAPGLAQNATYERAAGFRMRALLCDFEYRISNETVKAVVSDSSGTELSSTPNSAGADQDIPSSLINISEFQRLNTQNDWVSYFDSASMRSESMADSLGDSPGFSGMAPLLAVLSRFNLTTILDDPDIVERIGSLKGRFFMEMIRDSFTNPKLFETQSMNGEATAVENRVVVLTEIGFTLAALFYTSACLLVAVFWTSRLSRRPLNLRSDPASTIGLGLMFTQNFARTSAIKRLHSASRVDSYTMLQRERYFTAGSELQKGDDNADPPLKVKAKRTWRPRVIQARMLALLGTMLILVFVAVLILNVYSARSQLSQRAFIFEADVTRFRLSFSNFAPISIAPTVVSIIVGLWWDQLDSTFRILQPFISMSRHPTPIKTGAGLTYRSKSWVGAAFKAGRNRHWVLFLITIGSILAQVLTVSMSALFERESRSVTREISVPRNLELRQVPLIMQSNLTSDISPAIQVLDNLYLDAPKNWLYGAGIQQAYNVTEIPWTADGWSFLPLDLSGISDTTNLSPSSNTGDTSSHTFSTNITIDTPAIRARLECSSVEEIGNVTSWIEPTLLDNDGDIYPDDQWALINTTKKINSYTIRRRIFEGTISETTMLSRAKTAVCCSNGTRTDPQRAVMGYWSPNYSGDPEARKDGFPYQGLSWPMQITTKWLVGTAFNMSRGTSKGQYLYFTDVPRFQAARCKPIIETAGARVTLEKSSGKVIFHEIKDDRTLADTAWKDVFVQHESANAGRNSTSQDSANITTSFGVLFLDSLLGTSDRVEGGTTELTAENAFTFRDKQNGISMDLMTYSMYLLAEKDPEALLNYTTLSTYADRTFQTFFQHFVNSGLSSSKGGFAYQQIGDNTLQSIGRPTVNGTVINGSKYPILNTSRTVTASVSERIRVLHMNVTATYLSAAILVWLMLTNLIVLCLQRRYTRFMNRDVQLIADMLLLIAGSDNLLELIADKGVELKKNKDIKTMLGWFKDREGQTRWGIEVVGGRNAVSWVDAPKQGFHVVDNKSSGSTGKLLAWRPWKMN